MGGGLVKKHYIKKKGYYYLKRDRSLHRGTEGLKSHFFLILFERFPRSEVGLKIIILVSKKVQYIPIYFCFRRFCFVNVQSYTCCHIKSMFVQRERKRERDTERERKRERQRDRGQRGTERVRERGMGSLKREPLLHYNVISIVFKRKFSIWSKRTLNGLFSLNQEYITV